jgi:hypothetical protein
MVVKENYQEEKEPDLENNNFTFFFKKKISKHKVPKSFCS